MSSINQDETAIAAAAERKLAGLKARRVATADAALAKAKQRLAEAQQADKEAARNLAQRDWDGNRKAVLAARDELVFAQALVDDGERELKRAKAKHTPEQVKAATQLVTAERKAAAFRDDVDPVLADVTELAAQMALRFRAVFDRTSAQIGLRLDQRHAHDALGLPFPESLIAAPNPHVLLAEAILKGLRASEFSPHDWGDIRPSDVIRNPGVFAGAKAVLMDPDEYQARNRRWQERLHAEAQGNGAINEMAARQRELRAQAESLAEYDRATLAWEQQAGGTR